ncbi:MAG: GNAT family N-acetyltransferase [Acetobacteraceae bacterium]
MFAGDHATQRHGGACEAEASLTGVSSEALETVDQLLRTWEAIIVDYGRQHPTGDVRDLPGMGIRWADSRFPFWNCVTFTEPGIDGRRLAPLLGQAAAYMRGRTQSGFLWIFEDLLQPAARAALPAMAEQAGLAFGLTIHGMVGDVLPLQEPAHPALRFVRVSTEEALMAYADINAQAYGFPLEAGRDGLGGSALWKTGMHSYIGLADGVPVSAAAVVETDFRLFLALVATLPAAQRKGYGEATVRKALFEGWKATGITRSVLHATAAGAPVYERIGYRKVSTIQAYTLAT